MTVRGSRLLSIRVVDLGGQSKANDKEKEEEKCVELPKITTIHTEEEVQADSECPAAGNGAQAEFSATNLTNTNEGDKDPEDIPVPPILGKDLGQVNSDADKADHGDRENVQDGKSSDIKSEDADVQTSRPYDDTPKSQDESVSGDSEEIIVIKNDI